jgi:PAS domain S-box-containing protein
MPGDGVPHPSVGRVLQLLESDYRWALDALSDLVVVHALDGRMLFANRTVTSILECAPEDLLGRDVADFLIRDETPAVRERAATRLRGFTGVFTYVVHAVLPGGRMLPVQVESAPIYVEGRPEAVLVIGPDPRILGRLAELERDRAAAEHASQTQAEVMAVLSHEIRTPLNVIVGMTEMALESELDPTAREMVNRVRTVAAELSDLVRHHLDLVLAGSPGARLTTRGIDPRALITDALASFEPLARQKGLELGGFVDADVPAQVETDLGRLRQVLVNLIGNAIKYTHHGSVRIRVSRASTPAPAPGAEHLLISVADTGPGIAPGDRLRIFEPFVRLDDLDRHRSSVPGTGLGLAIAGRIVAALGGQIWVESVEGRGSVFHFTALFPPPDGP